MDKRVIRDYLRLFVSIVFAFLYIIHLIVFLIQKQTTKDKIREDVRVNLEYINIRLNFGFALLYMLHTNPYFRTLFYYRIGPGASLLISWYRKGDPHFIIPYSTELDGGLRIAHPYGTVLNAKKIGKNLDVRNLITIGKGFHGGRPVIGNDVIIGANVTIIGDITIGDNVIIGAGSVVVKDIPSNSTVVGNPARVLIKNHPN